MNRQGHFRECGYTPYACCGISFLTTTTVNTLRFSKPIRKVTKKSRLILEKLRIFVYNKNDEMISERRNGTDGIKGDISIREASCRSIVSERRVNRYRAKGRIPGASSGPFREMRKSRPPRVKQIQVK